MNQASQTTVSPDGKWWWDGQRWQSMPEVPAAAPGPAAPDRPDWLPASTELPEIPRASSATATPASQAQPNGLPAAAPVRGGNFLLNPQTRFQRLLRRQAILALAGVAAMFMLATTGVGGYVQRVLPASKAGSEPAPTASTRPSPTALPVKVAGPLGAFALQPGDLPSNLQRCANSGDWATYQSQLNPRGNASSITREYQQLQAQGAVDSWWTRYATSTKICDTLIDGAISRDPAWAVSQVVRFDTHEHALIALGNPSAADFAHALLFNDNILGITRFDLWWTDGPYLLRLDAGGLSESQVRQAGQKIDARLH